MLRPAAQRANGGGDGGGVARGNGRCRAQDVGLPCPSWCRSRPTVPLLPAPRRLATECRTRRACGRSLRQSGFPRSTCARRMSSLSITARSWRYCGSGALMMSELVVGSAWISPPIEGGAVALLAAPAGARAAPEPRPAAWCRAQHRVLVLPVAAGVDEPLPPRCAGRCRGAGQGSAQGGGQLARRRHSSGRPRGCCRWMALPALAGWSSLLDQRTHQATRAGLAARRISELLRGSASSVVLNGLSVRPCTAPVAAPCCRHQSGATPAAPDRWQSHCCSGITSTSVALDTSMAATMRARRCRLSA